MLGGIAAWSREPAAPEQAGAERAPPAGHAIGVGLGVADAAPPGPLVEVLLIGASIGAGGEAGRRGQVPSSAGKKRGVELAVEQQGLAGEGPDAPLVGDQLEGLLDAGLGERVDGRAGLAERIARIPDHVGDVTGRPSWRR